MKFPTDFTYRNLHGFARFPRDNTALVIIDITIILLEYVPFYTFMNTFCIGDTDFFTLCSLQ